MYDVSVSCDRQGCNARAQVPAIGASPVGWVQIRYGVVNLDGRSLTPGKADTAERTFCSWKCLNKYALSFLRNDVEESESA